MGQKLLTIDDLITTKTPGEDDYIAGEETSGRDFKITYKNAFGGQNATGYKNYVIDGDFYEWSDGTSFPATGWTADMWRFNKQTGTGTVTRQDNIDSDIESYFMRINMTIGATGTYIEQKLKDISLLAGKSISCFVRMKSSTGASDVKFVISRFDGSGNNAQNTTFQTVPSDDTWAWYRFDMDVTDLSGLTITSGNYTLIRIQRSPGSSYILDIDKVRVIETPPDLEDGDIPEWIKGDENPLAIKPLVRQYFIKLVGDSVSFGTFAIGRGSNSLYATCASAIANEMIQTPTITESNGALLDVSTGSFLSLGTVSTSFPTARQRFNCWRFNNSTGGIVTNHGYHAEYDNTGYVKFDARY